MRSFVTCILLFTTLSCTAKEELKHVAQDVPLKTIISGYLPQFTDSTVTVYLTRFDGDNLINYNSGDYSVKTQHGYFKFELLLDDVNDISCKVEGVSLLRNFFSAGTIFVSPGDSINMIIPDIGNPHIAGIQFSGKGSEKYFFLKELTERMMKTRDKIDHRNASLKQYIKFAAERRKIAGQMLRKSVLPSGTLDEYKSKLINQLYYSIKQRLIRQDPNDPEIRKIYAQQFSENFAIKRDLRDLNNFSVNSWLWTIVDYAKFDHAIVNKLPFDRSSYANPDKVFAILDKSYHDHPMRDAVLSGYLVKVIKIKGWDETIEKLCNQYLREARKNDIYSQQLVKVRDQIVENLSEKSLAYNFALPDTSGNTRTLEEFSGKVVLIDFMFYACGGCARLMPKLQQIEHQFEGEDVVFISISVDKIEEKFKKAIGKFSSPGAIALYTNGQGASHPIIRHYGIYTYPALVLIGKDGSIIDGRVPTLKTPEDKQKLTDMIKKALLL